MLRRIPRIAVRFSSSNSSGAARPPYELPEEKLRALTAIYHQSSTFITPENLSDRIDEAFAESRALAFTSTQETAGELYTIRGSQRRRAKLAGWDDDLVVPLGNGVGGWSTGLTGREQRVIDALYGVQGVGGMGGVSKYPGVEALQEREGEEKKAKN